MLPEEFVDYLWSGLEGTACIATVSQDDKFKEHFYNYPENRKTIVDLLQVASRKAKHTYVTPALLNGPDRSKENFKVSQVTWADWDKGLSPEIVPDLLVQTSPNKFHTYNKTPFPITDPEILESRNQEFMDLGADKCWDATRLLRVPGTKNGKNGWSVRVVPFWSYLVSESYTTEVLS